jgi:hypothetical protein
VLKNAYFNGETITRRHRDDPPSSFAAPRNRESMPIDANGSTHRTSPDRGSGRLGGELARAVNELSIALGGDHPDHRTDPG